MGRRPWPDRSFQAGLNVARASCWLALVLALVTALSLATDAQNALDVARSCRQSRDVTWQSLAPSTDRDVLDRWCDSVGPPLVETGAPAPDRLASVVVVTWNLHGGSADAEAFLASLGSLRQVRAPFGIVVLLQEAVRIGAEVPERYPARMRPPRGIRVRGRARDVGTLAARLQMHAVYVPAMRNGRLFPSDAREDRGNAILSTFPLHDLRAIELPFGRQRHVAVGARVVLPGLPPVRFISVHLDPSGHRTEEAVALATHLRELSQPGDPLVVGGDLNTWFGRREQGWKTLSAALPEEACGLGKTNTWPWRLQGPLGWWRGRLDYLFSTLPAAVARSCQTVPSQFGSDHRPVVMVIDVPG